MLKSLYTLQNDVFLNQLRAARESVRLRQADLAERLGERQSVVSKVERGDRRLDPIELRAWLMALGVDFVAFSAELDRRLQAATQVADLAEPFKARSAKRSTSG